MTARHARRAQIRKNKRWRIRVSIPVPRRCERRTLPIELIPHRSVTGVGFEPTPPKRLVPKTSALDHSAIQPFSMPKKDAPAGARTLDHRLIRPKRCQLRHKSSRMMQNDASGGFRTHDLGIMRPTRCQLRHRGCKPASSGNRTRATSLATRYHNH